MLLLSACPCTETAKKCYSCITRGVYTFAVMYGTGIYLKDIVNCNDLTVWILPFICCLHVCTALSASAAMTETASLVVSRDFHNVIL